jgi:ADP-heptose:LPS heptosyltransferase
MQIDKVLVIHNGALGDFLNLWPSLLALSRYWPQSKLRWAGRSAYRLWTDPLMPPASALEQDLIRGLYARDSWPKALERHLLIWFCLYQVSLPFSHSQLWTIAGLKEKEFIPPRKRYALGLKKRGNPPATDWPTVWGQLSKSSNPETQNSVLIFPGAGNRRKCWPLRRFLAVAKWLRGQGRSPVFILGPAELDRGLKVQNFKYLTLNGLEELQACIVNAELILGNDCGPLHLAGAWQRPTVSIFGPSSARQWAPLGAKVLSSTRACRPCTQDGRISCTSLDCLQDISRSEVIQGIESAI